MRERDFVLKPLCDIAPDWQHPADGKTAREFLNACVEINIKDTDEQW